MPARYSSSAGLPRAGHAEKDTFIPVAHTRRLHAAYAGDKELMVFDGDHNTLRPQAFYSSVLMFLHSALRCSHENALRTLHVHPRPSRQDSMHLPRQPQRRAPPLLSTLARAQQTVNLKVQGAHTCDKLSAESSDPFGMAAHSRRWQWCLLRDMRKGRLRLTVTLLSG